MKQKLLLLLFIPFVLFSQGKLKKAKKSLSKNPTTTTTTTKTNSTSSDNSYSDYDNTNPFQSFFIGIAYNMTLGIGFGMGKYTEMNPYPYYNKQGEYTRDFNDFTKRSSFKIGTNFLMNRIKGIELNALFKPIPIAGIEVSHLNFSENGLLNSESLNITSIMANYYRFREKYFSLWWGIGATYVGNEVNSWGFAYNLGTEIYPFKPISFHFSWKQSFINENEVDAFKAQVKYHLKKTALYTGYHNYKLGSETVSGVILGLEYTF